MEKNEASLAADLRAVNQEPKRGVKNISLD